MKVIKVNTSFGLTRSTGVKFEFDRIDVGVEATLEDGDDMSEVISSLQANLQNQAKRELMKRQVERDY